jgi:hypothetical protein
MILCVAKKRGWQAWRAITSRPCERSLARSSDGTMAVFRTRYVKVA